MTLNLGANIIVNGSPDASYDLVYYENENPANNIMLDWVILEIGNCSSGSWYPVFTWYDGIVDTNTNVYAAGYGNGEQDNKLIPTSALSPYQTGIAIDVDAVAPPGMYNCVRIQSPLGGDNDPAEVDSVQVLP
jgi:hypothetical protein